jgi:hypothetical protein
MAFGQQIGPPATAKQVNQLLGLLQDAGYDGFRAARGPLRLTQRQAGGKFTRDEADALIERLEAGAADPATAEGASTVPRTPSPATPRLSAAERTLREMPDALLAAELQRRGWIVVEP